MNAQAIAAIIGAISTFTVTFTSMLLIQRRKNKRSDSALVAHNYQTLFDELRKDIGRLRDEQTQERSQWADERKAFNEKIDKMQELIRTQDKAIHQKEVEGAELRGKVELLQTQLDMYKDTRSVPLSGAKEVTIKS